MVKILQDGYKNISRGHLPSGMRPSDIARERGEDWALYRGDHQPWDFLSSGRDSWDKSLSFRVRATMIFLRFWLDAIGETAAHKSVVQEIVFTDDRTIETIYHRAFSKRHFDVREVWLIIRTFPYRGKKSHFYIWNYFNISSFSSS